MYSKVIQLYIYIYILFQILFHYGLLQDIQYSSLCYTVGPCCLTILYIMVCICSPQTPNPSLPHCLPLSLSFFIFKMGELHSFHWTLRCPGEMACLEPHVECPRGAVCFCSLLILENRVCRLALPGSGGMSIGCGQDKKCRLWWTEGDLYSCSKTALTPSCSFHCCLQTR